MLALLLGFGLGFLGSVPAAGPLAMAIFAAALENNRKRALRLAVSGACAECVWATFALLGIGFANLEHAAGMQLLRTLGLVVLLVFAISLLRTRPLEATKSSASAGRAISELSLGFLMVATNPAFLVAWTGSAVFVTSLPAAFQKPTWAIVIGAFVGVVMWFSILIAIVLRTRHHFQPKFMVSVARAFGGVILVLCVILAVDLIGAIEF
jgi:threonine/homoserine/homoserine lactone efflux protein